MTYADQELRALDARVAVECYQLPIAPYDRSLVTLEKIPFCRIEKDGAVSIGEPWSTDKIKWFHQWKTFSPTASRADSFALLEWIGRYKGMTPPLYAQLDGSWVAQLDGETIQAPTLQIAIAEFALALAKKG